MKKIFNNKKYISCFKKQSRKLAVVFVVVSMLFYTLNVKEIVAYYTDIEKSNNNSFSATLLDFILTNNNLEKIIGPEVLGEISHASVVIPEDGSLPMQYDVSTTIDTITSNNDFCTGLIVEAKLNGITKYNGSLLGLVSGVTTEFGSWEFRFDLPPTLSIPNNVKCNASVLFSAWREDITNKADSSWHDEEILNISLTSRMVVLNEIYAKPNGATAPKNREYIELYNNSNSPVDVLGWQISEISGATEKFYSIVASGAVPSQVQPYGGASTIIPSGGFLVLEFGGTAPNLNDGGDTVKLYDSSTSLLDFHTYSSIPAGKSIVRYPDGIGFWVDPEATPGATNMVSMEDLRLAGFDDEMINMVLELIDIKNVILLSDTEIEVIEEKTEEEIVKKDSLESEPIIPDEENKGNEPTNGGTTVTEEPVIIEEENTTTPEEIDTEIKDEEIITPEELVEEEAVTEVPPVTEPEETVEEIKEEETTESVEPEESPLSTTLLEEIPQASPEEVVEVEVEEPAPAVVEEVTVSE